jgi:hypothetical protein
MGQQVAPKLDADIAEHIGYPRDRRTHLGLEFSFLAVLGINGVLDRVDSQFMFVSFDSQINTYLRNV